MQGVDKVCDLIMVSVVFCMFYYVHNNACLLAKFEGRRRMCESISSRGGSKRPSLRNEGRPQHPLQSQGQLVFDMI